jgi:hypothetical protein
MADNNHFPPQTFVVTSAGKKRKPSVLDPRIRLVTPDGTPYAPGEASTPTPGDAVADATTDTLLTQFNALLASLRAAGVIAGS